MNAGDWDCFGVWTFGVWDFTVGLSAAIRPLGEEADTPRARKSQRPKRQIQNKSQRPAGILNECWRLGFFWRLDVWRLGFYRRPQCRDLPSGGRGRYATRAQIPKAKAPNPK